MCSLFEGEEKTFFRHHPSCACARAPLLLISPIWRPLSALRWLVWAPLQKWRSALVTTFLTWRSARAPSSRTGAPLTSCPFTSWLQGAKTRPLPQQWTLHATLTRLAGLSRTLGFPLARGWWRAKLLTAVRRAPALRARRRLRESRQPRRCARAPRSRWQFLPRRRRRHRHQRGLRL